MTTAYNQLRETVQSLGILPKEIKHAAVMTVGEADALDLGEGVSTKTLLFKIENAYCAVTTLSFQPVSWGKLRTLLGTKFSSATEGDLLSLGVERGGIPPCGFTPAESYTVKLIATNSIFSQSLLWINPGRPDVSWQMTGDSLKSLFLTMGGIICTDDEALK